MMTKRRKNKSKSKPQTRNVTDEVKMREGTDRSRNNGDPESPQNEEGNRKPPGRSYMANLWHPSKIIDLFISYTLRLQLFVYQKFAGRLPLFLKGTVEEREESISKLNTTIKELTTKENNLTSENKRLNESIIAFAREETALQEANEELRKGNKSLLDASSDQSQKTETLQCKNEELKTKIQELSKNINEEENKNKNLGNKIKELDAKYKKEQHLNQELQQTKEQLLQKCSELSQKITEKDEEIHEQVDKIKRFHKEIKSLQQEKNTFEGQVNAELRENADLRNRIKNLNDENRVLDEEKQDALRRLSEQVSVKLRDNNPNIVDLSDQCRPTKLAEMFSELYDNEWTNAFSVLENTFTEKQAILILLDTVMIAYTFCEKRVNEPWKVLTDWFLDEDLPGAQQTKKWLKDSRKTNIQKHVPLADKNFSEKIRSVCNNEDLKALLSNEDINVYFTKCIELCLLMVATDPPVVLVCPGWGVIPTLQKDTTSSESAPTEKIVSNKYENYCQPAQDAEIGIKGQQSEVEEISQNQTTDVIEGNESTGPNFQESNEDGSLQEHEQDKCHQKEDKNVYADTEAGLSLDETQQKDIEKLNLEVKLSDESNSISQGNTDDLLVASSSQSEGEQNKHEERDHEPIDTTGGNKEASLRHGLSEDLDDREGLLETEEDKGLQMQQTGTMNKDVPLQLQAENQELDVNGNGIFGKTEDAGNDFAQSENCDISQQKNLEVLDQDENTNPDTRNVDEGTKDEIKPEVELDEKLVNRKNGTDQNTAGDEIPLNSENVADANGVNDTEGEICTTYLYERRSGSTDDTNEDKKQEIEEESVSSKNGTNLNTTGEEVPLNSKNFAEANEFNDTDGEPCTTDLNQRHNGSTADKNEGEKQATDEESANCDNGTSLTTTGEEVPLNSENATDTNEIKNEGESVTSDLKQRQSERTVDKNEDEKQAINAESVNSKNDTSLNMSGEEVIKQTVPIMIKRSLFDKELFKEYTRRGKYLDYIVWPALCLHKDGALLSKGVAQGSKNKENEQSDAVWTWRSFQ